jgi:hypothetical protein
VTQLCLDSHHLNRANGSIPFLIRRKQPAQDSFTLRGDIKNGYAIVRAIDLRIAPVGPGVPLTEVLLIDASSLNAERNHVGIDVLQISAVH